MKLRMSLFILLQLIQFKNIRSRKNHELDKETSQIRYMAVGKEYRNSNIGTLILKGLISYAMKKINK